MRHLFYIHSSVTYLVALEVVKHNKLEESSCVLLLGRGYRPPVSKSAISFINLPYTHFPVNSFAVERKFWKGWSKLRAFDDFVLRVTQDEPFHLYTNQAGIAFIMLFIRHKKCMGYSYLEEGIASYCTAEKINREICPAGSSTLFYNVLKYLNFKGRLSGKPYFYARDYKVTYGISKAAFPGFRNKVVVSNPFYNTDSTSFIDAPVVALDAVHEYGMASGEAYEHAVEKMFSYFCKTGVTRIWIKFHPEQFANLASLQSMREVISRHRRSVEVRELPPETSLELLAGNRSSAVKFFVFLSSVGMYAGLCGKEAYSFANYIAEHDARYRQRMQLLPDMFIKQVKFL